MAEQSIDEVFISEGVDTYIKAAPSDMVDIVVARAIRKVGSFIATALALILAILAWTGYEFRESRKVAADAITADIAKLQGLVDPVQRSIEELEEVVAPLKVSIADAHDRHLEVERVFQEQREEFAEFQSRVDGALKEVAKVEAIGGIVEFLYTEQGRLSSANQSRISTLATSIGRTNEEIETLADGLEATRKLQREFAVLSLPPKRESHFAGWPLRLALGKVTRSRIERIEVRTEQGDILARWNDLAEGEFRSVNFESYEYSIEVSSLSSGGFIQRRVILNGSRKPLPTVLAASEK